MSNTDEKRQMLPRQTMPNDAKQSRTNPEHFHKKATKKLPYQTSDQTRSPNTRSTPPGV